jgi:hypothetical protein
MLIECSTDVTNQNNDGETPLHPSLASLRQHHDHHGTWVQVSPQTRKCAEIAHMLLEYGTDVNARNKNGLTPFILASQLGLVEIIHVLVGLSNMVLSLGVRDRFVAATGCASPEWFGAGPDRSMRAGVLTAHCSGSGRGAAAERSLLCVLYGLNYRHGDRVR